jgi:hypothetical protein
LKSQNKENKEESMKKLLLWMFCAGLGTAVICRLPLRVPVIWILLLAYWIMLGVCLLWMLIRLLIDYHSQPARPPVGASARKPRKEPENFFDRPHDGVRIIPRNLK